MKMKWLKREFAALTAAVLTVVSLGGIPVSAATVAPHTRNYDFNTAAIANPASVTESELKAIFGEEWKGVPWQKPLLVDQGTSVDPKNTYRYAIVDKAFGKEPGDKAFRMWIDGGESTNPKTDPMQKLMLTDGMNQTSNNAMVLNKGEYLNLSFDMAFSGGMGEKGLQAQYVGKFAKDGRRYPIVTVTGGGEVKVLNQDVFNVDGARKVTLTQNSWYNFRLVMRAGDDAAENAADKNYYWFYIDNQLVKEGNFKPTHDSDAGSIVCFTGFNFYWFYQSAFDGNIPETATTYPERNLYLDNLKFISSKEQPAAVMSSKKLSFDGIGTLNDDSVSQLSENPGYWHLSQKISNVNEEDNLDYTCAAVKGGVYGKASDDYALDLYNRAGNKGNTGRTFRFGDIDEQAGNVNLNNVAQAGVKKSNNEIRCMKAEQGDYYDIEFYAAWQENSMLQLEGYYMGELTMPATNADYWSATGKGILLNVWTNGTVKLFNAIPLGNNLVLNPEQWYKFNLVLRNTADGINSYDFYVDNVFIQGGEFTPTTYSVNRGVPRNFRGFYAYNFINMVSVDPNNASYHNTEHHMYMDDFTATNYGKTAPVIAQPTMSGLDASAAAYLGNAASGYIDNGSTYNENWKADGNRIFLKKKGSDTDLTSGTALTEGEYYLRSIDKNGDRVFGILKNQTTELIKLPFEQRADNTALDSNLAGSDIGQGNFAEGLPYSTYTTLKYQAGLGGKTDGDFAANYITAGADKPNYNTFIQVNGNSGGLSVSKDFYLSYDYRMEQAKGRMNLQVISNGTDDRRNLLGIWNGKILDVSGKALESYTPGQWVHLGLAVHPSTNKAELFINGKYAYTTDLFTKAGATTVQRIKIESVIDSTMGGTDSMAVDNILLTQGSRPDAGYQAADLKSSNNNVKVDNAAKTVTVKGDYDASVLSAGDAAIRLYTDSTMQNAAASLVNGGMVVVDDGTTLRYYAVTQKSDAPYTVDKFAFSMNGNEITDGKFTAGTLSAKANLTVYDKDTKLSVITAQYKNNTNELIACKLSDTLVLDGDVDSYNGTAATITASITITETEGTYVKAFLWNMENGDIIPIQLEPIRLVAAAKGEISNLALLYPGYANKAVTFSFDDGRPEDQKIIEDLYEPYGIHGTFNLNSNLQLLSNAANYDFVKELYKNQEVASHVKNHPHIGLSNQPANISVSTADEYIQLIDDGISELNAITGQTIYGMAWPYDNPALLQSNPMDEAKKVDAYVKNNDAIFYARGGKTTGSFDLPTGFKDWDFTAYCKDVAGLTDSFLALPDSGDLKVFSIWGHAYDLSESGSSGGIFNWVPNDTYRAIEQLIRGAKAQNVWFPTNIEFVKYVNALRALKTTQISVTNPSDTDVYLLVNYKPVKVAAGETFTPDEVTMNQNPTVYLAGDSTCEIVPDAERPRTGWGEKLGDYLSVLVSDQAKAARSTKTFLNDIEIPAEGSAEYGMDRLGKILETAKSGDYLLIQFGHNDSMSNRPLRYTTIDEYKANLKTFVERARAKGVQPVLLTSIRCCLFENGEVKVQDGIESYRNAMKEVASELNVPLLDIGERWRSYLNTIGEEAAKQLYMVSYNGNDTTHPREEGAQLLAQTIAKEIKNSNAIGELSRYVK